MSVSTIQKTDTDTLGDAGKELVKRYFQSIGYKVEQPSAIEKFVDFIAVNKNTNMAKRVFVRTDTHMCTTGNIIIERFLHRPGDNNIEIGWLFDGEADILCELDAYGGHLYCFDWNALKQYVTAHYKSQPFTNTIDRGTVGDAFFIPVREIQKTSVCIYQTKIDVSPLVKYNFRKPNPF